MFVISALPILAPIENPIGEYVLARRPYVKREASRQ